MYIHMGKSDSPHTFSPRPKILFVEPIFMRRNHMKQHRLLLLAPILLAAILAIALPALTFASGSPYIDQFHTISTVASTVPSNGDINPYGVAVIPNTIGKLNKGNVLVSNFNASSN